MKKIFSERTALMYITCIFVVISLFFTSVIAESPNSMNEKPLIVPDDKTALSIAAAVCKARFGEQVYLKFEPYRAKLKESVWIVVGTSPDGMTRGGGMPEISISAENGAVLALHLSR